VSVAPSHRSLVAGLPAAGRWPLLERIPRRRFLRLRREKRIASVAGALLIAALISAFVEHDFPVPHALTLLAAGAWVITITWAVKQRWLRWLRDDFADEVNAKMDGIRRAAPFN
jgi:hypothetical protein